MKQTASKLAILLLGIVLMIYPAKGQNVNLYVSNSGSDTNTGTIDQPFATIDRAKQAVAMYKNQHAKLKGCITVNIREGEYNLAQTLQFTHDDSGTKECQIVYKAYQNEKVVISGGKLLTEYWEKQAGAELSGTQDEKAIWKLHIPEAVNYQWFFKQLFSNNKRLHRAASVLKYTKGSLPQFAAQIKRYDFEGAGELKNDHLDAWCGFEYRNDDLKNWTDIASAEVLVYHSWECSWHQIYKVDETTNTVMLKSPSRYPIGFFSNKTRYRVENLKEELDEFGEWYLDNTAGDLYYMAYPKEIPDSIKFVAPSLEKLMVLKGDAKSGKSIEYLSFQNLKFQHTSYPSGITSILAKQRDEAKTKFPWIDISTGFTDSQAAPNAGEAITLTSVKNIEFLRCEFEHLGSFAIRLGEYCHENIIADCRIHDLGAGGIIVEYDVRLPEKEGYPVESSPSKNKIYNNFIFNGGLVHPSAVAVLIMQANNTIVSHNEIYNFPYSGISCGWTWGTQDNYTKDNHIEYNRIHHVMNSLDDGGGGYTLGNQPGAIISRNYIHDIYRPSGAIGSFNNGIFFDEGSKSITVSDNVIHSIENQYIRFNRTEAVNMNWGVNYFSDDITKEAEAIIMQAGHVYSKK